MLTTVFCLAVVAFVTVYGLVFSSKIDRLRADS